MNCSRMLLCSKHLLQCKTMSVSTARNIFKSHNFVMNSFPCNQFRVLNKLPVKYCLMRDTYRYRYTFIYSKKGTPVINLRLSTHDNICHGERNITQAVESEAPLSKTQATELVLRLTEEERKFLLNALNEYESNQIKTEYEGQLAATRWRSKFGRPSKLPSVGDVDPTGSYCHLSEDWLKKKYAENVPSPTAQQLFRVAVFNAVPFIGFGFLDNFIMIVAGDYIDETLGSIMTLSTMAAAALGNTISDVMGIGSAWYVEYAATRIGLKAPNLSPIQLDMKPARRSANLGRALGIIIGCLLGMAPLLFIKKEDKKKAIERGTQ